MAHSQVASAVLMFALMAASSSCRSPEGSASTSAPPTPALKSDFTVEAYPPHLSTRFATKSDSVLKIDFGGPEGPLERIDWYAVGRSAAAVDDSGAQVAFEMVALPPTGTEIPFPEERKGQMSQYARGIPGRETTGSSSTATMIMAFKSTALPQTGWITVSLDMPAPNMQSHGLSPEEGVRRTIKLAVGSAPQVRTAAYLPAPKGGGAAKVALELTEAVPYAILRSDVFATLDGVPCLAPAGPIEGEARLWSLGCAASGGRTLVFGLNGVEGGLLGFGSSATRSAPLETAIDVSSGTSVAIE